MNDDYYECLTPETTIAILEVRTFLSLNRLSFTLYVAEIIYWNYPKSLSYFLLIII